jgi:hypothetical protein
VLPLRRSNSHPALVVAVSGGKPSSESNDEFKSLLSKSSDIWREWGSDEEQNYRLEECLYIFFTSALSVFESFAFCLYFLGSSMRPSKFPLVSNPRRITLETTRREFNVTFSKASITKNLVALIKDREFRSIDSVRNILAHRLTGRRHVRGYSTENPDGAATRVKEEVWNLLGADAELIFDEQLIQQHLNGITNLLITLVDASVEFAKNNAVSRPTP